MAIPQTSDPKSKSPHNLPNQLTPFVGRQPELAKITGRLTSPACRLLTLIGPGGIGKTRLAVQAGLELLAEFPGGVYFVPLQALESPDLFISTVADTLKFPLTNLQNPQAQLAHYLSDKKLLLILDNFEHLLAAAPQLTDVLHRAAHLKVLVTSREALNLQEEWLSPVEGLPYPTSDAPEPLDSFGAVQLFERCAQRVRPGFSLADEQEGVAHICRLVEGTPLALELAASWAKTLTCAEIAAEIRQNLDFLATRLRNVPRRHQSMQAVFDRSWALLSPREQTVFKRLAVFRGPFRRQAAERVAGASLASLTALVDKSLLRWTPTGRYQVHELLRQYAAEKLAQSPEDVAEVYDRHCAYYADFLYRRRFDVRGGRQRAAVAEIEPELENIRAAWQWASQLAKLEEIQKADEVLDLFYQFRGHYLEGLSAFERTIHNLDAQAPTVAINQTLVSLLYIVGWYYIRLGGLAEAEAMADRCQRLYARLDLPLWPKYTSDPRLLTSMVALIRGDYDRAATIAEEARQLSQRYPNPSNYQTAYYLLARTALLRGQPETAQTYIQHAYASVQATADQWFQAYCLIEMGNIAFAQKNYAVAQEHYQAAYGLRQEFDDPEGRAVALNHLGQVALHQNSLAEAGRLFKQSWAIYQEIGDKGGLATALNGLARSALAAGELETARLHFQQALHIAEEMQFTPLLLAILAGLADLLGHTNAADVRLALLRLIAHHPAASPDLRERAGRQQPSQADTAPATADDLARLLPQVQALLAAPLPPAVPAEPPAAASPSPSPLVEPLTEREVEVLQLMADGLTNPEIAERLIIATGTVKYYTGQIYGKLGVRNRVEAVALGHELHLF